MGKIIYPELSYEIMGVVFEAYNKLGNNLREKSYQKAIAAGLAEKGKKFVEQLKVNFKYKGAIIRRLYLDFLIEDKIVLEIKVGEHFDKENIAQVYEYLKFKKLKLAIIANFTKRGVRYKRIVYKGYNSLIR